MLSTIWVTYPYIYTLAACMMRSEVSLLARPLTTSADLGQERGDGPALMAMRDLRRWSASKDAQHATKHALELVGILPSLERSVYYPLCGFVAILTLWAYVKYATDSRERQIVQNDPRIPRLNNAAASPAEILSGGAELLAKGKAWRIGAALALLLAKQSEEEVEHQQ